MFLALTAITAVLYPRVSSILMVRKGWLKPFFNEDLSLAGGSTIHPTIRTLSDNGCQRPLPSIFGS